MTGDERRWLFVILAAMGLTLAALTLFLFGEHAPGVPEASPSQGPASATPAVPRLLVPPPLIAADEIVLCGYGRVKQSALDDIRAEARTAADSTFSRLKVKLAASRDAQTGSQSWRRAAAIHRYTHSRFYPAATVLGEPAHWCRQSNGRTSSQT